MSIKETLLKAKKNVRSRVENVLGRGTEMEPSAVRQEILNQIESRIVEDAGSRLFPFGKVIVRLKPHTKAHGDAITEALLKESNLKSDILKMLQETRVQYPREFETLIELDHGVENGQGDPSAGLAYEMDFIKLHTPSTRQAPQTRLQIIKGLAEKTEYVMNKPRILIGRSSEVLDREGRMVRCNDVVFLESEEEINCSVGHTHARIRFDPEKEAFFILDEGSRYGTRILRDSAVLEVPGGEPEGIRLQSGDDVYLGQACLRFTLI